MKKSLIIVFLSITVLVGLTACNQQVKLSTGIINSATVKSCAYDITVSADTTEAANATSDSASSMLNMGKVSLNFNGKMLQTEDRSKISSNVKVSSAGVSFETPVYLDSSTKKLDFNMFIGIPDILKSMLGAEMANKSNVQLASKDLESYVKSNATAEEYKKFQESMTNIFDVKSNKNAQVSKDMLTTFNSYLSKHKKEVQTFAKLGDKSASKNGVYTIKFSKEDIKAIISEYLSNEEYFTNYKAAMKEVEDASSVGSGEKVEPLVLDDAATIIADANKAIDTIKTLDIISTITIEDKLITKTNFKFAVATADGNMAIEVDSKLSEINKVTAIDAPVTNAENTINIMEFIDPAALN
jgi:hypothetical protein